MSFINYKGLNAIRSYSNPSGQLFPVKNLHSYQRGLFDNIGRLRLLHGYFSNQGLNIINESNENIKEINDIFINKRPSSALSYSKSIDSSIKIKPKKNLKPDKSKLIPLALQHSTENNTNFKNRLFIGNMTYRVTSPQLRDLFSQFGLITNVKLIKDQFGLSKGYGLVQFSESQTVEEILKHYKESLYLDNRKLRIQLAEERTLDEKRFQRLAPSPDDS